MPKALQDQVLKNYYQHFKHASLQRQLNYFRFKKRFHSGKKGMHSQRLYIHNLLTKDVGHVLMSKTPVHFPAALMTSHAQELCVRSRRR